MFIEFFVNVVNLLRNRLLYFNNGIQSIVHVLDQNSELIKGFSIFSLAYSFHKTPDLSIFIRRSPPSPFLLSSSRFHRPVFCLLRVSLFPHPCQPQASLPRTNMYYRCEQQPRISNR